MFGNKFNPLTTFVRVRHIFHTLFNFSYIRSIILDWKLVVFVIENHKQYYRFLLGKAGLTTPKPISGPNLRELEVASSTTCSTYDYESNDDEMLQDDWSESNSEPRGFDNISLSECHDWCVHWTSNNCWCIPTSRSRMFGNSKIAV